MDEKKEQKEKKLCCEDESLEPVTGGGNIVNESPPLLDETNPNLNNGEDLILL